MTDRFMLSRRQLLKTSAAGAALGIASSVLPFRAAFAASATVGFIYAVFFWTFIPLLLSIYEAIVLLEMSTTTFNMTYNVDLVLQLVDPPEEEKRDIKLDVFSMEITPDDDVEATQKIPPENLKRINQ